MRILIYIYIYGCQMMFMYDNRSAIIMHLGLALIHVPAKALESGEQDRAEQVADTWHKCSRSSIQSSVMSR